MSHFVTPTIFHIHPARLKMLKTLSKDRLDYLRAIYYLYTKSNIWDDEIIYDIQDTGGNFAENNELYLCIDKTELTNPDNDFIKNIANNFREKILLSDQTPNYETSWDLVEDIFGSEDISPQWIIGVEVKTRYPTGSDIYAIYDPNEDAELIAVIS